jgi:hypothetical protein
MKFSRVTIDPYDFIHFLRHQEYSFEEIAAEFEMRVGDHLLTGKELEVWYTQEVIKRVSNPPPK